MESIGLFYNESLDVLIGISAIDFLSSTRKTQIVQKNLIIFTDEKNNITNFNIFSPKKYLPYEFINGINSDNLELRKTLKKFFANINFQLLIDQNYSFIVGQITKTSLHPNADMLTICEVSIKTETIQIICGAKNCTINSLVVVACEGTIMPSGKMIAHSNLRGVDSYGMLCSEKELGLADSNPTKEIMILSSDKYTVGESFWGKYNGKN